MVVAYIEIPASTVLILFHFDRVWYEFMKDPLIVHDILYHVWYTTSTNNKVAMEYPGANTYYYPAMSR